MAECLPEEQVALRASICYTYRITVRFEWDDAKNRDNRKKHAGIAFEIATLVFDDPHVIVCTDRIVDGEQRWHDWSGATGGVAGCPRISHGERR